jgi:hypothetical protein
MVVSIRYSAQEEISMKETPTQYTKRILGYLEGRNAMGVLASTPRRLEKLVEGVGKKKLSTRPGPGKWSVAEILAHMADVEIVQGFRIRLVLGSNGTPVQGFDQDVWAEYADYAAQDPALSMEAFRVNRERTVRLLKSIPRKLWNNYGIHSERGKENVTRITEILAGHDINHLEQIKRILQKAR